MSDVVADFNIQGYTVIRPGVGADYSTDEADFGQWKEGDPDETLPRQGDVQIADGETLKVVPENSYTKNVIKVISQSPADDFYTDKTSPAGTADQIVWNGATYKVVHVDNWSANGYWCCVAVEGD